MAKKKVKKSVKKDAEKAVKKSAKKADPDIKPSGKKSRKSQQSRKSGASKGTKRSVYERLETQLAEGGGNRGGEFYRIPEGPSVKLRLFLFREDGEDHLFVEQKTHWRLEESDWKTSVRCGGDDCPVCALRDEVSEQTWNRIKPKRQFLCNAILRSESGDKHVKLQIGVKLCEKIVNLLRDEDDEYGDILDLDKGRDLKFSRSGKGLQTTYDVLPTRNTTKIGLAVEPETLKRYTQPPTEESLEAAAALVQTGEG